MLIDTTGLDDDYTPFGGQLESVLMQALATANYRLMQVDEPPLEINQVLAYLGIHSIAASPFLNYFDRVLEATAWSAQATLERGDQARDRRDIKAWVEFLSL